MAQVLIPLAEGFEEVEALAVVDILRRAGIGAVTATLGNDSTKAVTGRNGIRVLADSTLSEEENKNYDMIVLPGGLGGTENLKKDNRIKTIVDRLHGEGKKIAAICAAPSVLEAQSKEVIKGKSLTSHPSVRGKITASSISDERVVVDGNLITSQSPGTALEFAFKIVEVLAGKEKVEEVNKGVLARL